MKKRTLRNIIQGIIAFILLYIAFEFMSNDYINKYIETTIFSVLFLVYSGYCFNNGIKTANETKEELKQKSQNKE